MLVLLQWSVNVCGQEHSQERTIDVPADMPDEEIQEIAEAAFRSDVQPFVSFQRGK